MIRLLVLINFLFFCFLISGFFNSIDKFLIYNLENKFKTPVPKVNFFLFWEHKKGCERCSSEDPSIMPCELGFNLIRKDIKNKK